MCTWSRAFGYRPEFFTMSRCHGATTKCTAETSERDRRQRATFNAWRCTPEMAVEADAAGIRTFMTENPHEALEPLLRRGAAMSAACRVHDGAMGYTQEAKRRRSTTAPAPNPG